MSGTQLGFVIFGLLLTMLVLRVPIGVAMFIAGGGGYLYLTGGQGAVLLNSLKNLAYARLSNYDLVVIPLFLLMGQFATHGGLSRSLFRFVSAFIGHRKGGIAMARGIADKQYTNGGGRWRFPQQQGYAFGRRKN